MGRLTLLSLTLSVLYITIIAESAVPENYIQASCRTTLHPTVCVESLSSYANAIGQSPHKLAETALTVSLEKAASTKVNMLKLKKLNKLKATENGAMKDCSSQIKDSVDQLSRSVQEMEQLDRAQGNDFLWHKSNVETWVSAALTQMDSCLEGFSSKAMDGKIKGSVQEQVIVVEELISNALALFKQFVEKH